MPAPAAGFQPFTGTNAQVKSVVITPDLNSDIVTSAGTTVAMLGFVSFDFQKGKEGADVICAANPTDAQGNLHRVRIRGGIVKTKLSIEGIYDGNSAAGTSTDERFAIGAFLKIDIIYHGMSGYGIYGLVGDVVNASSGTRKEGKPATTKVEIEISGLIPAPSYPA